ncbi:Annexin [Stipitochalara longipes BDJ]|nr:Annexin [Stipitochalara longipes BDJ]
MSLDPRDNRRRGRSKSPGPREDDRERSRTRVEIDEYSQTRERSRVRVASPPSPPGRYEEPKRGYEYEEERVTVRRGDREDRGEREERGGRGGYGGGRGGGGGVSQYMDRDDSDEERSFPGRADRGGHGGVGRGIDFLPGKYQATVEEEHTSVHYEGGRGRGGPVREKEYYKETSYGKRDEYGRPIEREPERDSERDRRGYEVEVDKYKYSGDPRDKGRHEEDHHGRERGASFNVTAGHSSISGSIGVGHERHPSYAEPPRHGSDVGKYAEPHIPGEYSPPRVGPDGRPYAAPAKWEYAQPGEQLSYTKRTETTYGRPASPPQPAYAARTSATRISSTYDSPRSSKSQIVTVDGPRRRDSSPPGGGGGGLAPRMHSLSVSTGHHGGASLSLANAPGSPLLEAYHGTYQSISPMPSPLLMASSSHTEIMESISPISSGDEGRGHRKSKRTARFHDPVDEATILAKALKGEKRAPDTQPLIEILPGLTHEQILDLRVEYKHIVKTGHDKKGVNIAKHIKLRLKEEDPSLMKACYACALGKWESEAYWANFWYQGEKSRRELLIESLFGRTNKEIREIKDGFSDKKYSDSLTKCMKTELKEDKFKKAVLLVLEEKKTEERPGYGVDRILVEDDVKDLHKAVRSEKGGESAMIQIIVVRSDSHLREVLRLYESTYRANFAREMLKKSGNLVGEMLAHILNGVINKPVRDALLVHHALSLSKSDSIRTELLISRLVRYHWDRQHMEMVKREYRNKYGVDMQKAVAEGTKGQWGYFCEMLCVRRMPDDVREVKRVEEYKVIEAREPRY